MKKKTRATWKGKNRYLGETAMMPYRSILSIDCKRSGVSEVTGEVGPALGTATGDAT